MEAHELIDCVIPHFETHEEELVYAASRPARVEDAEFFDLHRGRIYEQSLAPELGVVERLEVVCSSPDVVCGSLKVEITPLANPLNPVAISEVRVDQSLGCHSRVSLPLRALRREVTGGVRLRIEFHPEPSTRSQVRLILLPVEAQAAGERQRQLVMRLFRGRQHYAGAQLERCLASLDRAGISAERRHVVAKRQSSAANRNEGFRRTSQPFVCFLDDDVELPADFSFEPLLEPLQQRRADLVSPKILSGDGAVFCADPYFGTDLIPRPRGLGEPDEGQYDYIKEAPWLPSTCLLVRREVFVTVGGFSEAFSGSQVEDVDFCMKARWHGFKCVYVGAERVRHHNLQRNDCHASNSRLFMRKWGPILRRLLSGAEGAELGPMRR